MQGVRVFPADVGLCEFEDASDGPVLELADTAIDLWRVAVAVNDPALLEALRPVLMRIGRILARDIAEGDTGQTRN